jgi:hypothetical protein
MEGRLRVETDFHSRPEVDGGKNSPRIREGAYAIGPWLTLCLVGATVLRPILWSAFSADDTFDSLLPMNLKFSGGSFWSFVDGVVSGWRTNEGRFFPLAVIVGGLSHVWFPEREAYKVAQFIVALTVVMLFAAFAATITRSRWCGVLGGLLLLSASQMRVQYDPVLQFSLQQPFLMTVVLLSLMAFLHAIRQDSSLFLFLSMVLFLGAGMTYESSVLLWPLFVFIALFERRRAILRWVLPTMLAPSAVVLHLLYLRSRVTTASSGYTSNFDIPVLLRTFVKQAGASLPMSYSELNAPSFVLGLAESVQPGQIWWLLGVVSGAILAVWCISRLPTVTWSQIATLALMGLTLWMLPALVVAQTLRWQVEIVTGNAYIPVYQGNVGFALVAVSVVLAFKRFLGARKSLMIAASAVLTLCLSLAVSSVISNNPRAVAQYDPSFRWGREVFTDSIKNGLFEGYGDSGRVLSLNPDWWLTPSVVNWYGGIRLGEFVTPQTQATFGTCLQDLGTCQAALDIDLFLATYGRAPEETKVVMFGKVDRMTGKSGVIKGIRVSSPSAFVVYPASEPSQTETDSESRCSAWFVSRMLVAGETVSPENVTIVEASRTHCLLRAERAVSLNPTRFTPS